MCKWNYENRLLICYLTFLKTDMLRHALYLLRSIFFGIAIWSCIRKIETLLKSLFHNKSNLKCTSLRIFKTIPVFRFLYTYFDSFSHIFSVIGEKSIKSDKTIVFIKTHWNFVILLESEFCHGQSESDTIKKLLKYQLIILKILWKTQSRDSRYFWVLRLDENRA